MDIELKEEFQNTPLRGKCFPMPSKDVEEIENRKGVQKVVADEFHPQNARKTPSQVLLGNPK